MAMIKGISVTLYDVTQTDTDAFGAPIMSENPVTIENVLVNPTTSEEIVNDLQLYGKHAVYELCIPKGDTHEWENRRVDFFGQKWRTCGFVTVYIEANVPLRWNKKVKVERYG